MNRLSEAATAAHQLTATLRAAHAGSHPILEILLRNLIGKAADLQRCIEETAHAIETVSIFEQDRVAPQPPPAPKPRVIVVLEGGLVSDVLTDTPVTYTVVDYDCEASDDEDTFQFPQGNGTTEPAFIPFIHNTDQLPDFDARWNAIQTAFAERDAR